jgi:cytoskeletal protein CcmA (bactofilin family)
MAANVINQISAANTFQQWLIATTSLIGTTNLLTNGNGESFFANTNLIVGGTGANVSLNVETSATINDLVGNTANVIDVQIRDLDVTGNIAALSVTNSAYIGQNLTVYGDTTLSGDIAVTGDLTVSGNLTLDALGFDDLSVAGSGSFGNTLSVTGVTTLSNLTVTGNVATLNVTNDAVFGNDVRIDGDLTVSGNITLDEIGFDDLIVSGSANIANNLTVTGTANTTGNATFRNAEVTGTLTANVFVGNANTGIYSAIQSAADQSIAFSIALG